MDLFRLVLLLFHHFDHDRVWRLRRPAKWSRPAEQTWLHGAQRGFHLVWIGSGGFQHQHFGATIYDNVSFFMVIFFEESTLISFKKFLGKRRRCTARTRTWVPPPKMWTRLTTNWHQMGNCYNKVTPICAIQHHRIMSLSARALVTRDMYACYLICILKLIMSGINSCKFLFRRTSRACTPEKRERVDFTETTRAGRKKNCTASKPFLRF